MIMLTIGDVVTRYYYDGSREIEERDAADDRVAYHVNGAQYVDERVATYDDNAALGGGQFTYYLLGDNYSVVGLGDAVGTEFERLDYTSGGGFDCAICNDCAHTPTCTGDTDGDLDIDLSDLAELLSAYGRPLGDPLYNGCCDFDCDDIVDLADLAGLLGAYAAGVCETLACPSGSGQFALHGRSSDVLSDGKVLLYVRARFYDPEHGCWLQRDPLGYVDGGNLYEAFRSNAARST